MQSQSAPLLSEKKLSCAQPVVVALVVGVLFAFYYLSSVERFVASDEGFYLYASKLVLDGAVPYFDFFYPQMPLLPYVYGGALSVLGFSWVSVRVVSSLLTVGVALFCVFAALRKTHSLFRTSTALVLFATNGFLFGWLPIAKTYSLELFFALLAYLLATAGERRSLFSFLAGVAVALAVSVRLFYVILIPIFVLSYLRREKGFRQALQFLLGGFLIFIPHGVMMLVNFDLYYFNNYGFHELRTFRPPEVDVQAKWNIVQMLLGFKSDSRVDGLQPAILLFGTALYGVWCLFRRKSPDLAFWIAVVLSLTYLLPSPLHAQYYTTVMPFSILCVIYLFHELVKHCSTVRSRVVLFLGGAVILTTYLLPFPESVERYSVTGFGVKNIDAETKELFQRENIEEVSAVLNELSVPGELVVLQWPGYLVESHAKAYPGLENQFWIRVGRKLSAEELNRYRLFRDEDLVSALKDPRVRLVVVAEKRLKGFFGRRAEGKLSDAGFSLTQQIHGVRFYQKGTGVEAPQAEHLNRS